MMVVLAKMVKEGEMENKGLKVLQDLQAKGGFLVCQVYQGQRDTEVFLVLMEQKVALDHLVIKEKKEAMVHLDLQDQWDQLVQEENEVEKDPLDLLASEELME